MLRLAALLLLLSAAASAQPRTDRFLDSLIRSSRDETVRKVAGDPLACRVQVIYTRIDRDARNRPHFTNYYWNYDPALYFNPASMVKLPLAFLSLEKLRGLAPQGLTRDTRMVFDSSYPGQRALLSDSTAANGEASLGQFIRRAFLVSENDPYNRMYQWVGQQRINRRLHELGYGDARILRQFMGFTAEGNRHSNGMRFLAKDGRVLYEQPPLRNPDSIPLPPPILVGRAHLDRNDSLIEAPMDFAPQNNLSLLNLQQMLQSVLFPASVPPRQRFRLGSDDRAFLLRWLSQFPSETDNPKYDTAQFYDSYVKFFFRDSSRRLPEGVRVFNKVGWAYGFLTDVSYVMDRVNKVEYMLAATIYVNSDGVLNDGKYDYETVGHPFLRALGETVYRYELGRPRRHRPDLRALIINYGHRNPRDTRPVLRDVDN
ncbi:hypothetical protein EPD60_13660 [Flaviaesturariibacter flavus]|uniref:Beta-lactamase class A catalytic domain-containing protein n=1 Tax=Flaviaesturariibacter flavus TaxID=2502780 RepID=A0A4R1B566_9BACT|nr:serine hydrolase [Flaviaesturariibacter flavus]TCJ13111.1 hypothetical protein EPD60_13660 [Flaviaesturariibacter flavus]